MASKQLAVNRVTQRENPDFLLCCVWVETERRRLLSSPHNPSLPPSHAPTPPALDSNRTWEEREEKPWSFPVFMLQRRISIFAFPPPSLCGFVHSPWCSIPPDWLLLETRAAAQMGDASAVAVWHANTQSGSLWRAVPGAGCWTGAARVCLNWAGSSSRKETPKLLCTAFWAHCWGWHRWRASTRYPTACIRWALVLQDGAP